MSAFCAAVNFKASENNTSIDSEKITRKNHKFVKEEVRLEEVNVIFTSFIKKTTS